MAVTQSPAQAEDTQRPSPARGTIVFGAMLIVVGMAWLLERLDVVDIDPSMILPSLLAVIGIALLIGAWDGEHSALVVLGVIAAILTVIAAVTPFGSLNGGIGDRQHTPRSAAELSTEYTLAIGQLNLDLTELATADLGRQHVTVRVGAGEATITVPPALGLAIDASVGAGDVILFDTKWSGLNVDRSYRSPGYVVETNSIVLDIEVMAGQVEVTR